MELPTKILRLSYHSNFFQDLIAQVNKTYTGTAAEIQLEDNGEVSGNILKRMAILSTILKNPQLQNANLYPMTPLQLELILERKIIPYQLGNCEDLALVLYDTQGANQKEAQTLKKSIIENRDYLGLNESDLEKRLVIVNAGAEVDMNMPHGIRPIIIPGITQVYHHEVLNTKEEELYFRGYGLDRGLPKITQLITSQYEEGRAIIMPEEKTNIGLRVFQFTAPDNLDFYSHLDNSINLFEENLNGKNKITCAEYNPSLGLIPGKNDFLN